MHGVLVSLGWVDTMTSGHSWHQGKTCMHLLQKRASCFLMVQLRGHKVCIVEKRRVEGRLQEWNVSRSELQVSQSEWLNS